MKKLLLILLLLAPAFAYNQNCYNLFTGNPYMPMHAVITEIRTDDYQIQRGDIIAVYDNTLCVGFTRIERISEYYIIILRADDPTTPEIDGYIVGNELIFKYCALLTISTIEVREHYTSGDQVFTYLGTWVGGLRIKN